ncbi:MAG: NAD(P)H-dependent oxidoreductase [Archangiaceae bacterium]|nr:NAD(P)H-dependent oxidoreductase [Archangiaceae bacterium]
MKHEQRLLDAHQAVVFQHPFHWYSAPSLVKDWQDLVLEYGRAYGRGGDKLRGKVTRNAITTGGPVFAYRKDGWQPLHHARAAGAVRPDRAPVRHEVSRRSWCTPRCASRPTSTCGPTPEAYCKLPTRLRDETPRTSRRAMKVEKVPTSLMR